MKDLTEKNFIDFFENEVAWNSNTKEWELNEQDLACLAYEAVKLFSLPDVTNRFCNCEGHKYSETKKCAECNKPLPPY